MNLKVTPKEWLQIILFSSLVRWSVQKCSAITVGMDYPDPEVIIKCFGVTNLTYEIKPLLYHSVVLKATITESKFDIFHKGYFGTIHEIKELTITNCDITTIGERAFEGANVDKLALEGNGIQNILDFAFNSSKIISLNLSNNSLSNIKSDVFKGLPALEYLSLSHNKIRSIEGFENLPRLTSLHLSHNLPLELPNAVDFAKLQNLAEINLSSCNLSSLRPKQFTAMESLQRISLDHNNFLKIYAEAFPKTLSYLNVSNNRIRDLYNTSYLVNLRTLDLSHNALTNVGTPLADLTSLESLYLQDNLLEKMDCADFENKPNLLNISLSMNSIRSIDNIRKCPPSIENLNLSDNSLARMGSLSNLKNLMSLDLSGNALTDIDYSMLQNLSYLKYLNLSRNGIKTLPLGCFRDLVSLTELRLHLNYLSNLTHGVFGGLNHLTLLDLGSNELKKFDVDIFLSLMYIASLDISNNQLESFDLTRLLEHKPYLNYFRLEGNNWNCSYLTDLMIKFRYVRFVEGSVLDATNVRGIKCEVNTRVDNGAQEISSLMEVSDENVAAKLNGIISLLVLLILAIVGNLLYKIFMHNFTSSVALSARFKDRNKEELQLVV